MRRAVLAVLLATTLPAAVHAGPVSKDQLSVPPADAAHYVVVSDSGKHGDMWRWTLPDGRLAYRHSQSLRGWISETDEIVTLGPDGLPTKIDVRGITPNGDAAETYNFAGGKAVWKSLADSGASDERVGYYLTAGGISLANDTLADKLAAVGSAGVDLLPTGHATLTTGRA